VWCQANPLPRATPRRPLPAFHQHQAPYHQVNRAHHNTPHRAGRSLLLECPVLNHLRSRVYRPPRVPVLVPSQANPLRPVISHLHSRVCQPSRVPVLVWCQANPLYRATPRRSSRVFKLRVLVPVLVLSQANPRPRATPRQSSRVFKLRVLPRAPVQQRKRGLSTI
jgi:hypothetical protein